MRLLWTKPLIPGSNWLLSWPVSARTDLMCHIVTVFDKIFGLTLYTYSAETIARDLQNEEIQSAWQNVQVSILERRAERNRQLQETSARLQGASKQMEAWAVRNAELDANIEELQAKFANGKVALEYDAKNVADRLKEYQPWKKAMPCLGQRAHWIDCQKKYAMDTVSHIGIL